VVLEEPRQPMLLQAHSTSSLAVLETIHHYTYHAICHIIISHHM